MDKLKPDISKKETMDTGNIFDNGKVIPLHSIHSLLRHV